MIALGARGPVAAIHQAAKSSTLLEAVMNLVRNGLLMRKNCKPTENRTNREIRIPMRFFSRVHKVDNTLL